MALDVQLQLGVGDRPSGAQTIDHHHPAAIAAIAIGAARPELDASGSLDAVWLRSPIPSGRGLGFSGAARVAGAALGVAVAAADRGDDPAVEVGRSRGEILTVAARLEGHGDNAAASTWGGVVAWVDGRSVPLRLGPVLADARVVTWIPGVTTSTDRSRSQLALQVDRSDAIHNLGRVAQFILAIEHDDPSLLAGATDDRLHQPTRLRRVPGAAEAIEVGVQAGAWCGWLSGSGPTVALLCDQAAVAGVEAALPGGAHTKVLSIAPRGVALL